MKKRIVTYLIFGLFLSFQVGTLISVSSDDFEVYIKKYGTSQLLDVRTPQEFNQMHIEGAKLVNVYDSDFREQIRALNFDKNKPILIYSRSGNRSLVAGRYLSGLGYEVINLKYGINEWKAKGKPVKSEK